jgi:hypothetical protein
VKFAKSPPPLSKVVIPFRCSVTQPNVTGTEEHQLSFEKKFCHLPSSTKKKSGFSSRPTEILETYLLCTVLGVVDF